MVDSARVTTNIFQIHIILADDTWHSLYDRVKKDLAERGMVSTVDLKNIFCTSNNEETYEIIALTFDEFKLAGGKICLNIDKYQP